MARSAVCINAKVDYGVRDATLLVLRSTSMKLAWKLGWGEKFDRHRYHAGSRAPS